MITRYQNLLVIDESEADCYIATHLIDRHFVAGNVHIVKNGNDAINYLGNLMHAGNNLPEAIILDVKRNCEDCIQFLDFIKDIRSEKNISTKIIAISSVTDHSEIEDITINNQISLFIPKPLNSLSVQNI